MENNVNFIDFMIGGGMGVISIVLAEKIMEGIYYPSFSVKLFIGLILLFISIFIKIKIIKNDN